jgi:hypothetical protein
MKPILRYLLNILISLDQLANVILLGAPDETLSSRAYRARNKPFGKITYPLINFLFFWQDDHCKSAYESEILRKEQGKYFSEGNYR